MQRIYATPSPELDEALAAAATAHLVAEDAPKSERLRAWALYGYQQWRREMERRARVAAYQELAADPERAAMVRASAEKAAEVGLF